MFHVNSTMCSKRRRMVKYYVWNNNMLYLVCPLKAKQHKQWASLYIFYVKIYYKLANHDLILSLMVRWVKLKLRKESVFLKKVPEQGTLELDTLNPDRLILISNKDTFNFLLNPLFFSIFGYSFTRVRPMRVLKLKGAKI